jgi:hypothetical protein
MVVSGADHASNRGCSMRYLGALGFGVALLAATPAFADSVTIGTYTDRNCAPFGCGLGSYDYIQLYSASAFSAPITFDKITFFQSVDFLGPTLTGDYTVSFSTTTDPIGITHAPALLNTSSFFSGPLGGPAGASFSISGQPYSYDPASGNLVMEIVVLDQQVQACTICGTQFLQAEQSGPFSRYVTEAGTRPFADTVGLVTQFTSAVPEPSTWAMDRVRGDWV